ncbi:MAG: hypothetical protein LBN30_00215 [Oscillospiraceae bacterium]|nr:hypothetical protein [Oscillospiraceae bacterium]
MEIGNEAYIYKLFTKDNEPLHEEEYKVVNKFVRLIKEAENKPVSQVCGLFDYAMGIVEHIRLMRNTYEYMKKYGMKIYYDEFQAEQFAHAMVYGKENWEDDIDSRIYDNENWEDAIEWLLDRYYDIYDDPPFDREDYEQMKKDKETLT